jgi:hypothetical protein
MKSVNLAGKIHTQANLIRHCEAATRGLKDDQAVKDEKC